MNAASMLAPEEAVIAAVLSRGMEIDGPDYWTMPCGRAWAELGGLDPQVCYDLANRRRNHAAISYKAVQTCRHLPEHRNARAHSRCRHGLVPADWV